MLSYIARRILYMVIMIILVSFVSFLIIDLPPGDYLTIKIQQLQAQGDLSALMRIDEYRARYKLDQPLLTRYWNWITNFVKGDFGESFEFERPVKEIIGQRAAMSVLLALFSIIIVWCLAIPIGVYSATHQYSVGDQIVTTLSFLGLGMPGFLLALLVLFFGMMVLKVEVGGLFSREFVDAPWSMAKVGDLLKHLWIPALISSVTGTASLVRIMRGNLLETLGQPFVEAARARGLKNSTVTWKHAVRVAINPLVVILTTEALPSIVAGDALVATVLNLPTVGPLFVQALKSQDMFLAGTVLVFIVLMTMIGSLIGDLTLAALDPRIRLE
ncbi:MAG: ABC transporter permease [Chloroflexi bacterium]|mgnify:FL=1|nr:ABC transporter permease [Chloroflexota bacterium]OQB02286.1 MAG: Oligopeptide transport system permease protein OppB [Chloroflexi bacterium ADurb.Bin222]HOC21564.1 ABC transporter permease [Anaerolineae bacterium]HOS79220.1 ABC transporter permease [Anaerolineae bacterium]HQJ10768.1 ABC transporter permease [Anaerolineae bacterium]